MRFLYHPLYLEPTKYPLWRSCRVWKIFRLFPLPPPKKKHPRPTNPNHKRLFQGAHRLQHHGLFRGWMEFFWEWEDLLWKLKTKRLQMFRRRSLFFWKKNSPNHKWCFFLGLKTRQKVAAQKKGRQFNIPQVLKLHPFSCITYDWISRPVDPPPTALFFVSSCLRWRSWLENGFRLHGLKVHKAVRPFRDSNFRTLGFPQKKNPGPELGNPDRKSRWCWWC